MIEKLLRNILDVPGADGVCVFDLQGNLLCNRFPSLFIEEIFPDLGRRVALLFESVDDNFVPTEDFLLRFEGKLIFIRRNEHSLLLVLADEKVNLMSLRMVTNLALKHFTPELLGAEASAPKAASKPAPGPASAPPSPVAVPAVPVVQAPVSPAPSVSPTAAPPAASPAPPPAAAKARYYRGQTY